MRSATSAAREHRRLFERAERMESVRDTLRRLAADTRTTGGAPRPLQDAIAGFDRELHELRLRLRTYAQR